MPSAASSHKNGAANTRYFHPELSRHLTSAIPPYWHRLLILRLTIRNVELFATFSMFLEYLIFQPQDCSDKMDAEGVQQWVNIIMDAFQTPNLPRPGDEPIIGEIICSFWSNAMTVISPNAQIRFIKEFEIFLKAVVEQAQERESVVIVSDVDAYMKLRRNTLGAKPAFALLEMNINVPDTLYDHPLLVNLRNLAVDMILLANDLYSFNVEQSKGDDHNIITHLVLHGHLTVQDAINHVAMKHSHLAKEFLEVAHAIPEFDTPEPEEMVRRLVDGLGNWIQANECWSFETWRYFQDDGLRVQKERSVSLLPRNTTLPPIIQVSM
uniref:Terpene synthase n=1 Tax=Mycena chlorophos TaxID=658473 RepID=A0ABQ0M1N8_MYCCL|nr:predicted protein [Mycena chlorophos]